LPEELARRRERLEKIREAKAQIEELAEARYEQKRAEYDERMAERAEKEQRTGKKIPGREPAPPEPGPQEGDQVNFTDPESRIMPTNEKGWNKRTTPKRLLI